MKSLFVMFLAAANVFAVLYAPQPLLPLLAEQFQISVPTASLTISLTIIGLAVASLLLAPISDRWDRKQGILVASLLFLLPTFFLSQAESFTWILILRAWQGLCIPGVTALLMAYAVEEFPAEDRGRVMGTYISATVTGGLSGRLIAGPLAELFSWQTVFAVFSVITLLVIVFVWRFLPPSRNQAVGSASSFLLHFANPKLVGTFFIGFSQFFSFIGVFTYLPFYVSQSPFDLSVSQISMLYVTYLFGVFTAPVAGFVSDRIGRRSTMAIGHLIGGAGILLTLWPSIPGLLISLSLLSIGNFASQSAATAYVGDAATRSRGAANALYQFFYYVGGSLGAWLPGILWETYGWHGTVLLTVSTIGLALIINHLLAGKADWGLPGNKSITH